MVLISIMGAQNRYSFHQVFNKRHGILAPNKNCHGFNRAITAKSSRQSAVACIKSHRELTSVFPIWIAQTDFPDGSGQENESVLEEN